MANNWMKSGPRTIEYAHQTRLNDYTRSRERLRLVSKDPHSRGSSIYKTGGQDLYNSMDILYFMLTSPPELWKKPSPGMLKKIRYAYPKYQKNGPYGIWHACNRRYGRKF